MFSLCFSKSLAGDRGINLDHAGHLSGDGWSLSYVIDGYVFISDGKHYSSALNEALRRLDDSRYYESIDVFLAALSGVMDECKQYEGSASAAFVVYIKSLSHILSVGDTRVYQLKDKCRTVDDTVAQRMVDAGYSVGGVFNKHPYGRKLTKNIKLCESAFELTLTSCCSGEVIICSDGFWHHFDSDDLIYRIKSDECERVMGECIAGSGSDFRDDMTLVFLRSVAN